MVIERALTRGLIFLFAGFFLYLGVHTHWADSELWSLALGRGFPLHPVEESAAYKPFFYLVLSAAYLPDFNNLQTILATRWFFAINGLALVYLTYRLARELTEESNALFAALLLLVNSFFLSQGFRIRSDLLAATLQIAGLLCFLKCQDPRLRSSRSRLRILALVLPALALLATPKAIYHLALNAVFIFAYARATQRPQTAKRLVIATVALPLAIFLVLTAWRGPDFASAFDYYARSFVEQPDRPAYFSAQGFFFVWRLLKENVVFIALAIVAFATKRGGDPKLKALTYSALAAMALMVLHNDRLPFYLASLLPLIAIAVAGRTKQKYIRFAIPLVAVTGLFYGLRFATQNSNGDQRGAVATIEGYLAKYPDTLYYDATGALPRSTRIYAFPAPEHAGNLQLVTDTLAREDVDLVFMGNRLYHYFMETMRVLDRRGFIDIGGGVYARAGMNGFAREGEILKVPTKEVCYAKSPGERLYAYEGSQFLKMRPVAISRVMNAKDDATFAVLPRPVVEVKSRENLVSCTRYAPLEWPEGSSFAQVFDFDPEY